MERARALAVVPARLSSQRLPRKVLLPLGGRPLIVHTLERARRARLVERVVLATSDQEVADVGRAFGFEVVATTDGPRNGTERVWEVARHSGASLVVNVQADEVLIEPATIDAVIEALASADIATAAAPLREGSDDPNVVKVTCRLDGRALYFSRSRIPSEGPVLQHVGMYGFRREILERCATHHPTPLEGCERLEQLRWIEAGFDVAVVQVSSATPAVNTTQDLDRIRVHLDRA